MREIQKRNSKNLTAQKRRDREQHVLNKAVAFARREITGRKGRKRSVVVVLVLMVESVVAAEAAMATEGGGGEGVSGGYTYRGGGGP